MGVWGCAVVKLGFLDEILSFALHTQPRIATGLQRRQQPRARVEPERRSGSFFCENKL